MKLFTVTSISAALALSLAAHAEAPKKGRIMCEGGACKSHDVPTGSVSEFAEDFTDRVKRRIDIANQPKPASSPKKHESMRKDAIKVRQSAPVQLLPVAKNTNLPEYYQGVDRSEFEASEKVISVPKSASPKLKGIKPGDVIWAVVEQEILASPGVPTPVRAISVAGAYKGGIFLGEATLDRELKRVLFSFYKLRLKDRDEVFALKATGLSPRGSIGLEGEYVSQTGKFFLAELASAAATGFVDSTVNRNQTAAGTYVQEPTFANSAKTAAVTALSKTTERMTENARNAPEYTQLAGYQNIQIMIQEEPSENSNN